LKFTHNEKVAELYRDILDNYKNYSPEEVVKVLAVADNLGNMQRAIDKGMFKGAEASTFATVSSSWFSKNIEELKKKELPYLSNFEKEALFSEEGEDVFNSLPRPTKERLLKEIEDS
jgi:hypothetical protein